MTSIDGGISITGNAVLSIAGPARTRSVVGGSVSISSNSNLDYCEPQPFTCCMQITGTLTITGNRGTSVKAALWCYSNNYGCLYNN